MGDVGLKYSSNPKHKEPWQRGRKGTLCPAWSHALAQELLDKSEVHPDGNKKSRYATRQGLAFEAHPDGVGGWHGYPVGWHEVPPSIYSQWLKGGMVERADIRKNINFFRMKRGRTSSKR